MPIYEYVCTSCNHHLEAMQSLQEQPLHTCPHCQENTLQRGVFSAPNFQLKGKGWYKTDYTSSSMPEKSTATEPAPAQSGETVKQPEKTDA